MERKKTLPWVAEWFVCRNLFSGASFGAPRSLAIFHEPSKQQFDFPQENGISFPISGIEIQRKVMYLHFPVKSTNVLCMVFLALSLRESVLDFQL